MNRLRRNYYQISKVDRHRNQEQLVAEVEELHEAEKLVKKYLTEYEFIGEKEITYRVSKNERQLRHGRMS